MDGNDFIAFAGRLAANPHFGPAEYRSASSRAYYGAYHLALVLLRQLSISPPNDRKKSQHEWVKELFLGCQAKEFKVLGRLLGDAHTARIRADYRLDFPKADERNTALTSVERAEQIRLDLQRFSDPDHMETSRQQLDVAQRNLR